MGLLKHRAGRWGAGVSVLMLVGACTTSEFEWQIEKNGDDQHPNVEVTDISSDTEGNSYITGYARSFGNEARFNWFVDKYDANGNQSWSTVIDDTETSEEELIGTGKSVLVVDDGVISLGTLRDRFTRIGATIVKLNDNGERDWIYQLPLNMVSVSSHITANGDSIFYGGVEFVDNDSRRLHFVKLNSAGEQQWHLQQNMPDDTLLADLDVTANGEALLSVNVDQNALMISYDAFGNQLWARSYEQENQTFEVADTVIADDGDAYIIGNEVNTESGTGAGVYRIDASGDPVWQVRMKTLLSFNDYGNLIAVSDDQVYAVSNIQRGLYDGDVVLRSLDAATGDIQWSTTFANGVNSVDTPQAIDINGQGKPVLMVNTLLFVPGGNGTSRIHTTNVDGSEDVTNTLGNFVGVDFAFGQQGKVIATGESAVPLSDGPSSILTTQFIAPAL